MAKLSSARAQSNVPLWSGEYGSVGNITGILHRLEVILIKI
jgi:hypothetical protein